MKKTFIDLHTLIMLLLVVSILLLFYFIADSNNEYEKECEKKGGVPVYTSNSINCATSGYINIRKELK